MGSNLSKARMLKSSFCAVRCCGLKSNDEEKCCGGKAIFVNEKVLLSAFKYFCSRITCPDYEKGELTHQVESAEVSYGTDNQNGGHGFHTVANCLHQKEHVKGREHRSCTDTQNRIHGEGKEDFSSGGNNDEANEANCDLSDSCRGVKTPPSLSYKINEGSTNLYSKAGLMDEEDESGHGGEFGGGEAVESNEYDRCQETLDFYLDMEDCLDEHSNIVLEQLRNRWDLKSSRWKIAVTTRSADGEENSSSVNTK